MTSVHAEVHKGRNRQHQGTPQERKNGLKSAIRDVLAIDPFGVSTPLREKLSDFRSFHWRDYRVVFKIDDDLKALAIVGIGKKTRNPDQNIYRRLEVAVHHGELAHRVLQTLKGLR